MWFLRAKLLIDNYYAFVYSQVSHSESLCDSSQLPLASLLPSNCSISFLLLVCGLVQWPWLTVAFIKEQWWWPQYPRGLIEGMRTICGTSSQGVQTHGVSCCLFRINLWVQVMYPIYAHENVCLSATLLDQVDNQRRIFLSTGRKVLI